MQTPQAALGYLENRVIHSGAITTPICFPDQLPGKSVTTAVHFHMAHGLVVRHVPSLGKSATGGFPHVAQPPFYLCLSDKAEPT